MGRWTGFIRSLVIYHNPLRLWGWRRFYRQILGPGDVAFDVGAHVGSRARAMRAAGARVVALEPQQPFARFLSLTLPRDICLIEAAAGRAETEAEMAVSSRHPTVSSLRADFVSGAPGAPGFEHVRWDGRQRVRMITLDGLIARFGVPRYVKIDVEGYEIDVLAGLSTPVPVVSVEFLPGFAHLTHAVIDRLTQLGAYRFNPVRGETGGFLWAEWRDGPAVKAWLDTLPPDAPSGDLFARLPEPA
ncbi:FkbM family methyltransferase [Roseovarius sp. SYSU LYC5161]|uniref:FkbM family methyltransferase n=1 Tax=Roseovarius halophilus (ex Wu et al. 2025) TaxID=3376060 RepID=UPI0028728B27|nr:FkbM family methyltransferase [Roseovarius sp.]